jgi:hypothetical protein
LRLLPRFLAVVLASIALALTSVGAASADVPEGWSDPDEVSFMHALLVLGGIPLAVIVLLALATYVPAIVRGESLAPAGARPDDEWFGGRRDAEKALESPTSASTDETGGASGSW